jgi:hypothetical protein
MPRRVLDLPNGDFELIAVACEEIAVQRRAAAELASADLGRLKAEGADIRTRAVRLTDVLGEAGRLSVAAAALRGARPAEELYPPTPPAQQPRVTASPIVAGAPVIPGVLAEDPAVMDDILRVAFEEFQQRQAAARLSAKHDVLDAVNAAAGIAESPPATAGVASGVAAPRRSRARKTTPSAATASAPPRDEELARQALAAGAPDPEGEQAAAEPLSEAAAATLANLRAAAATPTPYHFDRAAGEAVEADAGDDVAAFDDAGDETEAVDETAGQGGGS